jgi:nucleotide-binding universal stress UspA family protein
VYKRIVVPLDGSTLAEEALKHATEIAKRFHSEILLVRVVGPGGVAALMSPAGMLADPSMGTAMEAEILAEAHDEEIAAAHEYIDSMVKKMTALELKVQGEVMEGHPAEAIMHFAHKERADLIVLTTHGRTGLARMVMGSVADQLVRQCGCPVLLVRNKH